MGRSKNTALVLVSQNAGDLLNEQVTNCISAVFAFRSSERAEVGDVLSLLGVEVSDEHAAVLRSLGNGECIFRDLDGRAGRIVVDLISDDLRRWLDTNPTRASSGQVPVTAQARGTGGTPMANGQPSLGAAGLQATNQPGNGAPAPAQMAAAPVPGQRQVRTPSNNPAHVPSPRD